MRTLDFAPLWRSTIGFDHLFDLADHLRQSAEETFPPYNIGRSGEDSYRIIMAVAGFAPEQLNLTYENNQLMIVAEKPEHDAREYLHKGIGARAFQRRFELADHVRVVNAALENGVLTINLLRELPEAMKPRRSEVVYRSKAATETSQIGNEQAA